MRKNLKFAGSSVGEPWWLVGRVTKTILEERGYTVDVLTESASTENPRYVGRGKADLGACVPQTIGWAVGGEHNFAGEEFSNLRAVARIRRPSWLAVAARHELGFTDLRSLAESDYPIRLLTHDLTSIASVVPRMVLEHYGLTEEQVQARGGSVEKIGRGEIRAGAVDLIVANLYMGRSAVTKHWIDASVLLNLRFYDMEQELLDKLIEAGHGTIGEVPFHFLRGVDRDVRSLSRHDGILVYLPEDADADFVYELAKAYDENRERFFLGPVHMAYDPKIAASTAPLELHPGALRYYQEAGMLAV